MRNVITPDTRRADRERRSTLLIVSLSTTEPCRIWDIEMRPTAVGMNPQTRIRESRGIGKFETENDSIFTFERDTLNGKNTGEVST